MRFRIAKNKKNLNISSQNSNISCHFIMSKLDHSDSCFKSKDILCCYVILKQQGTSQNVSFLNTSSSFQHISTVKCSSRGDTSGETVDSAVR